MFLKILTSLLAVFYVSTVFSKDIKNTVVIKNEASATINKQDVIAPALVPSDAKRLRNVREQQEIRTEDYLLKELEKRRLVDEQKRINELLGPTKNKQVISTKSKAVSQPSRRPWTFGDKTFVSFGTGVVSYPGVENVNSTETPAGFFSFGGYGYNGNLIFDLSIYYSKHYLKNSNNNYQDIREVVEQPAFSMSVKFSPLRGQVKPYLGASSSLVWRKWDFVHKSGTSITNNAELEKLTKDVAYKQWNQSFDAGLALGADIALGKHLGFNLDVRYHWNLYTENRKTAIQALSNEEILDERDSLILSGSLRYYF